MNVSIDIVIVNWNAGSQLRDCLDSIITADRDGLEIKRVVLVDNASSDGSSDGLQNNRIPLAVIRNTKNRGFGAACNQGAKDSCSDYLLFLNPDTRLFSDSLSKPLAFMEQADNQNIGIAGIQLIDNNRKVSRTCSRFPTPLMFFSKMLGLDRLFPSIFPSYFLIDWDHNDSRLVDHVIGAFFLVRRSLFNIIDGFDERFFVYIEDLDFSLRARQSGWRSYYLAEVQAFHKGGGTSENIKAKRLFYALRSRILYGYKHFGWWAGTGLMGGTLFLEFLSRFVLASAHHSRKEINDLIDGYSMLLREVPNLLKTSSFRKDL
jgi:hypothetical protein